MEKTHQIQIWFFIGGLLGIYGIIILCTGIFHLFHPPARQLDMSHLHPDIWWGGLLVVIGLIYLIKFWPDKNSKK